MLVEQRWGIMNNTETCLRREKQTLTSSKIVMEDSSARNVTCCRLDDQVSLLCKNNFFLQYVDTATVPQPSFHPVSAGLLPPGMKG
jgi:hypothetical protein